MDSNLSNLIAHQEFISVSLGMVIIDEIRLPNRPPIIDVAGGSALFATLGCRILSGNQAASKVGCLVLAGYDFPQTIRERLQDWGLKLVIKTVPERPSSRGLLEYEDDTFGPKKFQYTTTPLKASPHDLIGTSLINADIFHMFATPQEIENQVPELIQIRSQHGILKRPFIVWEPFPAACRPSNRSSFLEACKLVDIFSPNHLELANLYHENVSDTLRTDELEEYASDLYNALNPESQGAVIVRAGSNGTLTVLANQKLWLPALYTEGSIHVVDPTGAGNTFLGGFIAGWHATNDLKEASIWGNVAASFAIEQIGLPSRKSLDGHETWNGTQVSERLNEYKERLRM
ncbi:Ribokinase-like protein [Corynespora cassiicola Philippines]|uniref:Ribokinase-like protein n=1 Tax=Corynespora cassiicola Philippines TaxID=1448308 RepID=A0A2T2NNU0_CORCC|nr:Ribokinase-like protein [Corynespora cassiicola Philippines]